MKEKLLLLIMCILTITLCIGCKNDEKKKTTNNTPLDTLGTNSSKDDSNIILGGSTKPTYTIENISKEMLAKKTIDIFSEPSSESNVLGQILANKKITITGKVKENGWYRVSYNNTDAYIHFDNLEDIASNETPPAPKDPVPPVTQKPTPPAVSKPSPSVTKDVKDLKIASQTDQLILVSASGTRAKVSMHTKNTNGSWNTIFSTDNGYVGMEGLGKTQEGVMKTPIGAFRFTKAFGIKSNPGTQLEYTVVDDSHYWVDDPNSQYYNRFVSTKEVTKDWASAERIVDYTSRYNYCLALDYNSACIPGAGSAIFLHCTNYRATGGCIAIPEEYMIKVLKNINKNCVIIIDTETNIWNY